MEYGGNIRIGSAANEVNNENEEPGENPGTDGTFPPPKSTPYPLPSPATR
jgi:hypothetical protein